jgi:spore maturation protein A
MMKWVFSGFVALAVLFGAATGRMDEVSNAALTSCGDAVQLVITLTGSMCLWSGLMKVADTAGLTEKLSLALRPVMRLLFRGMSHASESARAITMNMAANLLGLGNAATPLGIAAMRAMAREERAGSVATDNMVMFVVLNTASLQLIPTTTAIMRAAAGSPRPLEITPAVWLASAVSVAVGVAAVRLMGRRRKR